MLDLSSRDRCFVIAEAGTCHAAPDRLGRLELALRYVDAAARAGASAIKFQMFSPPIRDDMFCWIDGDEERSQRWADSALSLDDWREVKTTAETEELMFLASVFQHSTVEWLRGLEVEATKVASRAAADFPYEGAPKPFLISNGIAAVSPGAGRIILECESNYPSTLQWSGGWPGRRAGLPGFSDHSGTPWRAIDAIAHGCKLIEVHFFIDPLDAGPDLPASLTLDQLQLVCEARDAFAELRERE